MTTAMQPNRSEHRADYTLERGVWRATCKSCGHAVSGETRQRAAGAYREHIKETRLAVPRLSSLLIDLTHEVPDSPARQRALRS